MRRLPAVLTCLALSLSLSTFVGCSGGDDDDDDSNAPRETVQLLGTAFLPEQTVGGQSRVPAVNAPVDVLDLSLPEGQQVIASGVTDGDGRYKFTIPPTEAVAVVVTSRVRVSGLIDTNTDTGKFLISKNFDEITDLACEAGVTAVLQGALQARELGNRRIANLEKASLQVLQTNPPNFFDPASVTAAAQQVRAISNDGEDAP